MDAILWITLLLALFVSLAALAYVVLPLLTKQPPLLQVEDDRLTDLLVRKDSALRALKELEFDHQVGKIDAEDYQRFNQRLSRQAITLIQQLEQITPESAALDERLEAEIAQHRQAQTPMKVQKSTPSVSISKPVVTTASAFRFCTQCGTRLEANFKFCASCGAPVTASTTVTDKSVLHPGFDLSSSEGDVRSSGS